MNRLPFRRRLTVWSTIVAAVALIVSGAITAIFVHNREMRRVDETLVAESEHFFSELGRHGGIKFDWRKIGKEIGEWLPPSSPPKIVEIRTGNVVRWHSQNFPKEGCGETSEGIATTLCSGKKYRISRRALDGITFTLGMDLDATHSLLKALGWALVAASPVALVFAWLGGRRLARLAVLPIEEMTDVAEGITAEHIDKRVPVPPVADELQRHALILNRTFDRLERSYQHALRFSADASHELKSPLTVMRSGIEALMESPTLSEHDQQSVGGLLEQTRRLSNIISSLLLLARADAGRLELDFREVELSSLISGCVEDARIMADERCITVESSLPTSVIAWIDALRFSQIVSNLLDNAVKYNHPGGEIRVSLTCNSESLQLSVANTGAAIPEEMRPLLFERFFRAEHTGEGGQGLGLGLARELARAHGGDVVLTQSETGWNVFAFNFQKSRPAQKI